MQLLSNESAHRSIEEPKISDDVTKVDEDEWEGFGEETSEEQVDTLIGKGTASRAKEIRKTEKKQKKKAVSQPQRTRNTFEALGRADEDHDEDIANDEEGDGKQNSMVECFFS